MRAAKLREIRLKAAKDAGNKKDASALAAKPGDIAETVLLPGDPYRARWAAETCTTREEDALAMQLRKWLGTGGAISS